ncbi:hypothetical protein MTsPCn9_06380 [Croceitalea sp. MTPC9]|uniref:hypothetical protein n=1 Tax=unclassified Croceitalea TaxID=2632280 RepID=UPI002B3A9CB9|nr:hypothetical protein MTsPCn6_02330 [Croceitalea sp. MTPC6]GMN15702.1 hypothetical protein MTsPCn9_06380 [Croceitalea sp. MTPC9]
MKKLSTRFLLMIFCFCLSTVYAGDSLKGNFTTGNPQISSINSMAFGPEGILFIGDSKSAQIVAVDLSGQTKMDHSKLRIDRIDQLLADMIGSATDELQITDMVVDPSSNNIYVSVNHSSGKSLLFKVIDNTLKQVPLTAVSFSKISLDDPIAMGAKDRRDRDLRKWAVADIGYSEGKVMVSGLSNKEFASTFRVINFPFENKQAHGSLEIYHAAHGKYETHAPIKAFLATNVGNEHHLVAGYTCTPLVLFPMEKIELGRHNKGRTVAELGSGNSPVDMIEVGSGEKRFLLIANTNRPLMRMKFADIEAYKQSMTNPVTIKGATEGVAYVNMPFVNVQQLDNLEDGYVMIQREANGNLALKKGSDWWIN